MVSQGLWGAIEQYWTVDEKPRLHRRNTVFEDYPKVSSYDSLKVGIVAISTTVLIVVVSMLGGIL